MHDEWLRVASDGFVARLPGGAHAQEHRLRPLPVRPRRDDGNELVEHGAPSSSFCCLLRGSGILLRIERGILASLSTSGVVFYSIGEMMDFQNRERKHQRAKSLFSGRRRFH